MGSISLYRGDTFEPIPDGTFAIHSARISDLVFSPDNTKFATSSEDSLV